MVNCPKCGAELEVKFVPATEIPPDVMPAGGNVNAGKLDDIKAAFSNELPGAISLLSFTVGLDRIVVKTTGFIKDKTMFSSICNVLARFEGNYISEGKNTRWEVPL